MAAPDCRASSRRFHRVFLEGGASTQGTSRRQGSTASAGAGAAAGAATSLDPSEAEEMPRPETTGRSWCGNAEEMERGLSAMDRTSELEGEGEVAAVAGVAGDERVDAGVGVTHGGELRIDGAQVVNMLFHFR